MANQTIEQMKERMSKAIQAYTRELASIRAG
ncbi:MAG TPA: ribosome recycling factor, partial [Pseudobacillus sp.]